jgi:hypothetical protein
LFGAIEIENALAAVVIGDLSIGLDIVDAGPGIKSQTKLAQSIDIRAARCALEQEFPGPGDEVGIEIDADLDAEVAPVKRLDEDGKGRGRRPGIGIAR